MTTAGWEQTALVDLVEDAIGGLWGSSPESNKPGEVDVLVVRGADFRQWESRRAMDAAQRRIPAKAIKRRKLEAGDLVLEVSGGGPAQPVGRVLVVGEHAVSESTRPLVCSNFCRKIRLKPGVDPFFVKRQLDWMYQSGHTDQFQTSTTNIRNLQVNDFLHGTSLAIPDLPVQKAVTELLNQADDIRSRCSTHVSSAARAIERFRHAVIAAACLGRLTADWREQHCQDSVAAPPPLSATGVRNASGAANSSDLAEIPETWKWWTVESMTSDVIDYRGRTPPSDSVGPIPHVRTTQIRRGRIDWNTDRFVTREIYDAYMTRGIPQRDDVLFTMEAPMGEVGVVDRDEPFSVAQRILLLRPTEDVDGGFLALALQSHPVQRAAELRATGSGVVGIAYKRLRSVEVPKPPIAEQQEIVRITSQLLKTADMLTEHIDTATTRVHRSSQAVLAEVFRGGLSPNGTGAD